MLQLQSTPPLEGLRSVIEPGAVDIDIDIFIAIKLSITSWYQIAPKRLSSMSSPLDRIRSGEAPAPILAPTFTTTLVRA